MNLPVPSLGVIDSLRQTAIETIVRVLEVEQAAPPAQRDGERPQRAGLIQTEVGAPLLKLVRLMHDMDERPVLHLTAYMAADRASVMMEIAGATVNKLTAGQIVLDAPVAP
jgi:hypothetical protein